jgi:folate-binding protein YgfZ
MVQVIYDISNYIKVIKVSGEDSAKFLQGQTCNDVLKLPPNSYQLSANLNNKGRIFTNFWLYYKQNNLFYIIVSNDMAEALVKRLKMYVLRSKVDFEIGSGNIILTDDKTNTSTDLVKIELLNDMAIYFDFEVKISSDNLKLLDDINIWYQYLFINKIPLITKNLSEKLLVQQINFDEEPINGVSYQKGCYIGQEIVARMHYLGKNKQKMYSFISNEKLSVAQVLYTDKLPDQEIGVVVVVYYTGNKYIGLSSIQSLYTDSVHSDKQYNNKLIIK